MSTLAENPELICHADRCYALQRFIVGLGNVSYLLEPENLAKRLTALDELDFIMGDLDIDGLAANSDFQVMADANAIKSELEAANEKVFAAARSEIALQKSTLAMRRLILELPSNGNHSGLGFDVQDELVNGILRLREPRGVTLPQSPETVAYQPTPARHILDLIAASELSREDVLIDLGSGLGHVSLLASILTGSCALGIEFQPSYVASAQESAQALNVTRARFVSEDARTADLSTGTVFYMFSPFSGSILADVLNRLRQESKQRQLRICSLGPCTRVLQDQAWLEASRPPDTERVAIFKSR